MGGRVVHLSPLFDNPENLPADRLRDGTGLCLELMETGGIDIQTFHRDQDFVFVNRKRRVQLLRRLGKTAGRNQGAVTAVMITRTSNHHSSSPIWRHSQYCMFGGTCRAVAPPPTGSAASPGIANRATGSADRTKHRPPDAVSSRRS